LTFRAAIMNSSGTRCQWPALVGIGMPRKKPPAPYALRRPDLNAQIVREVYTALERLGAGPELLAIVGSWRDTLDDADVLRMLREYNAGGKALHRPQ
jgi:hypothetical protein